jgi:photosystem II stability/assembly factor-like uncharacterized protein
MKKIGLLFTINVLFIVVLPKANAQWVQINNGIPNGNNVNSYELAIWDSVIFAASHAGIYKSYDNGNNWTIVKTGQFAGITIKDNDIYIGGYQSPVYVSHDTGVTWQSLSVNGVNNSYRSIFLKDSLILIGYGYTGGGGVFKSTDNGNTFSNSSGIPGFTVVEIAELGNYIYAAVVDNSNITGGVYKSSNNGTTFYPTSYPILQGVKALAIHNGIIYAPDQYNPIIYMSSDSGATWTPNYLPLYSISGIGVLGNNIFAGNNNAIYFSPNNGANWYNTGSVSGTTYSVFFNNGFVFVGTAGGGIWRNTISSITSLSKYDNIDSIIKIFPNPTHDHITINYGNYSKLNGYTVKITNTFSQTVFTAPITQQQSYVDLSMWSGNGIYFVHLIDAQNNTIEIKKIILQ